MLRQCTVRAMHMHAELMDSDTETDQTIETEIIQYIRSGMNYDCSDVFSIYIHKLQEVQKLSEWLIR